MTSPIGVFPRPPSLLASVLSLLALGWMGAGCTNKKDTREENARSRRAREELRSACDKTHSLGVCIDFTQAAYALGEDVLRSSCAGTHGKFSEQPCPEKDRLGTCELPAGQLRRYYEEGPARFDSRTARTDCERSGGRWSVPISGSDTL